MNEINYKGMDCVNLTNGTIELYIAKHFGPRVIFAGFKNGDNMFGVVPDVNLKTPLGLWKIHGGHRLWIAPEVMPDTYYPDNEDVQIKEKGGSLSVVQVCKPLNLKKEMVLSFLGKNKVKVVHNIYNTGIRPRELAVWALSLMKTGGFAIIPQNQKKEDERGFLPNRNIVLWTYTDAQDKRFKATPKYFYVKQGEAPQPFKIGQRITLGWSAYFNKGNLFVKRFEFEADKNYPDFNSNVEIYSCGKFLEVETISPLVKLDGGKVQSYVETWEFYKDKKIAFGQPDVKI